VVRAFDGVQVKEGSIYNKVKAFAVKGGGMSAADLMPEGFEYE
jgi:hypothetical protein